LRAPAPPGGRGTGQPLLGERPVSGAAGRRPRGRGVGPAAGVATGHQGRRPRLGARGLFDLKRLYWDRRRLRPGNRRGPCPYERRGLALPPLPWGELLQWSPEELRQQRSAPEAAA